MKQYPKKFYIASGIGMSQHDLVAFDNALIHAGVSNYNIVRVSSILPKACEKRHNLDLEYGSPLLAAYAAVKSNEKGKHLATAVAVGVPKSKEDIGVIMEASGEFASETEDRARAMVIESMDNHHIALDHIETSSIEGIVENGWLSLVSVIAIW